MVRIRQRTAAEAWSGASRDQDARADFGARSPRSRTSEFVAHPRRRTEISASAILTTIALPVLVVHLGCGVLRVCLEEVVSLVDAVKMRKICGPPSRLSVQPVRLDLEGVTVARDHPELPDPGDLLEFLDLTVVADHQAPQATQAVQETEETRGHLAVRALRAGQEAVAFLGQPDARDHAAGPALVDHLDVRDLKVSQGPLVPQVHPDPQASMAKADVGDQLVLEVHLGVQAMMLSTAPARGKVVF